MRFKDLDHEMLDILLTTQHEAGQKELPFYIFGAGLPSVPTKLGEIKTYAERLFSYHPLERLNDDQTRLAYADPIAKMAVVSRRMRLQNLWTNPTDTLISFSSLGGMPGTVPARAISLRTMSVWALLWAGKN